MIDSPILLLFSTAETSGLPIKVFEAVADETVDGFVQLDYGIETGEAERIAVDGISRGTSDESASEPCLMATILMNKLYPPWQLNAMRF